jgi:hypothetical protein
MNRRLLLASALLCAAGYAALSGAQAPSPAAAPAGPLHWYKGNTHTHTLNSDGDSTPDEVVRWYRDHRYHFLVLTDHNFLTDVTALDALHGADERFLVIKGEEVSSSFEKKPLHINGLDPAQLVEAQTAGTSVADVLQKNVDAIRMANGVPHINHPNFGWAITADDLASLRNNKLFEVYNGHPMVNNLGGSGHPGLEQVWDTILSRGVLLYGIATDDAHHFKRLTDPTSSRPGQGWVVVRAATLEARAILEALERGDFYASTGVELADYQVSQDAITIKVKPITWAGYRIQFIGKGGTLLEEVEGPDATYRITGTEGYVRAKVLESDGSVAWTQPVMTAARR